jgi:hypothetical protein
VASSRGEKPCGGTNAATAVRSSGRYGPSLTKFSTLLPRWSTAFERSPKPR